MVWVRVAVRLAHRAAADALNTGASKEACLDLRMHIIRERWGQAKRHISEPLHTGIRNIISELPDERQHA